MLATQAASQRAQMGGILSSQMAAHGNIDWRDMRALMKDEVDLPPDVAARADQRALADQVRAAELVAIQEHEARKKAEEQRVAASLLDQPPNTGDTSDVVAGRIRVAPGALESAQPAPPVGHTPHEHQPHGRHLPAGAGSAGTPMVGIVPWDQSVVISPLIPHVAAAAPMEIDVPQASPLPPAADAISVEESELRTMYPGKTQMAYTKFMSLRAEGYQDQVINEHMFGSHRSLEELEAEGAAMAAEQKRGYWAGAKDFVMAPGSIVGEGAKRLGELMAARQKRKEDAQQATGVGAPFEVPSERGPAPGRPSSAPVRPGASLNFFGQPATASPYGTPSVQVDRPFGGWGAAQGPLQASPMFNAPPPWQGGAGAAVGSGPLPMLQSRPVGSGPLPMLQSLPPGNPPPGASFVTQELSARGAAMMAGEAADPDDWREEPPEEEWGAPIEQMSYILWKDEVLHAVFHTYWNLFQSSDIHQTTPTESQLGDFFFAMGKADGGIPIEGFEPNPEEVSSARHILEIAPATTTTNRWGDRFDQGVEEAHAEIDERRGEEFRVAHSN